MQERCRTLHYPIFAYVSPILIFYAILLAKKGKLWIALVFRSVLDLGPISLCSISNYVWLTAAKLSMALDLDTANAYAMFT